MMDASYTQTLIDALSSFGIQCDEKRASLLLGHLDLLVQKNKVLNLTRITDLDEALILHVVDSLLPLACDSVSLGSDDSFVDIGTGGGFPGIPLGVMTGAKGLLVDSVGKKVAAVSEFVGELGLSNLNTEHIRVEELAREKPGHFDFVFARAVAQTNVLVEYAAPLLKHGGRLVVQKGRPDEIEVMVANRAASICGMKSVSRETFELPQGLGHREILVFEKVKKSKIALPRRTGMAKSDPLGTR